MKFFIKTLGCKMNWLDSTRIAASLITAGHQEADSEEADTVLVNSCTVTHQADKKSLAEAKKVLKSGKQLIIFGCSANIQRAELEEKFPAALIFDSEEKLLKHFHATSEDSGLTNASRTRLPIAIQTGCDCACTFCITHVARGKSQNFPVDKIIANIQRAEKLGVREVVLTGINVGAFGCEKSTLAEQSQLPQLLETILEQTKIPRIRISSLGPQYISSNNVTEQIQGMNSKTINQHNPKKARPVLRSSKSEGGSTLTPLEKPRSDQISPFCKGGHRGIQEGSGEILSTNSNKSSFFEVFTNPRICDHLHLSVQSGSDEVLRNMGRNYTREDILNIAESARQARPDVALAADIIVGFPRESDLDFEQTVDLVKKVGFAKLHVFPYSPRAGTPAADFDEQIPDKIKKSRAGTLRQIGAELRKIFIDSQIGKKLSILAERDETGLSSNYIRVKVPEVQENEIVEVELSEDNLAKDTFE